MTDLSRPATGVAPPAPAPLGTLHQRRVRLMLLIGSGIVAGTSLFWGLVFAVQGHWLVLAFDVGSLGLAGLTARLTLRGRLQAASRLLMAVMFVLLCLNGAVFDVPSAEVPRSAHQFLLALGAMSWLLTREEPAWLRHGIPLACFSAYLVFASTNAGFATSLVLPDTVRASGAWINHGIALITLYAVLNVIQADVAEHHGPVAELRDALVHQQLQLHYQPQLAANGQVIGAEALMRWQHRERGLVPPAQFIPLAERSGLMLPLGDWVLRTACAQLMAWREQPGLAGLSLSVNVSALQFQQRDFVQRVQHIVQQSGADPRRLKLELTESMLAHDVEDIVAKMAALKATGIALSLDDFGTGFSSLSYLRRLPLDELKIDQSFVRAMLDSDSDSAIVQTVVTLGRTLGLKVIAEGVETAQQRQHLAGMGCLAYQGYLFSRPLPAAEFAALVSRLQAERAAAGNEMAGHNTRATEAVPCVQTEAG